MFTFDHFHYEIFRCFNWQNAYLEGFDVRSHFIFISFSSSFSKVPPFGFLFPTPLPTISSLLSHHRFHCSLYSLFSLFFCFLFLLSKSGSNFGISGDNHQLQLWFVISIFQFPLSLSHDLIFFLYMVDRIKIPFFIYANEWLYQYLWSQIIKIKFQLFIFSFLFTNHRRSSIRKRRRW